MKHPFLIPLLLAVLSGSVFAEKADRGKPMNIEADALRHDELKQTSVFTGRVVVTKGSIVLRGARLDVRQDADGYQHGVVTAEPGKRAFFRQKRDTPPGAPSEFIEGESEVIEYDGRTENVRFVRRAEMRKLRDSAVTDELSGGVIVYNNLTDVFSVEGQQPGAKAGEAGGRVKAVLSPKEGAPGAAVPAQRPAATPLPTPGASQGATP